MCLSYKRLLTVFKRLRRRQSLAKIRLGESEQKKGPHDPVIPFSSRPNTDYLMPSIVYGKSILVCIHVYPNNQIISH